jgi:hypothetical protein
VSHKPTKLERICRGQRCYLGFPGVCSGDSRKVVPCHLRIGNVAGSGQKPPPICCLPGCHECHAVLDGRAKSRYSRDEIRAMTLMGFVQWLAWLWTREYIAPGPYLVSAPCLA